MPMSILMAYYSMQSVIISFLYLVTLSYNSTPESGFYIGQPLTVRCKQSKIQEVPLFILELYIGDAFSIRCERGQKGWKTYTTASPPADEKYTALTKDDCILPEKDNTMSVKFIITEGLKNLNITCYDAEAKRYSDLSLVITETKCEYTR